MHDSDTAIVLRGVDRYRHFRPGVPAATDLDPAAVERQRAAHRLIKDNYVAIRDG